ncbi:DHA2 family efflux MFS transporter permease subunit [Paractinoplanes atraurantiacus]|uniref:Drug resistance transporter, EmrB/QacA subfamily n=1 Tax=Paractinoplanes atraurantiacus TaxID=1036182 RepID=A0A285FMZ6_9ACTN|nr:DHA2 family efflux MFS transporter permease subunit [Actinoplanes atraurantiacus]SNY12595.1 drug resistance transporter, EmrB/QacA subfamily [Actinoplanes atraurantiacus]
MGAEKQLSHRHIVEVLAGLMLGMFLAALDQTIVTAAIRTIGDDLHGLSMQAWVTTAYLITATISTPLYGKLSDIYGRKRFFLAAITIFVIGSAACAFAGSMYQLAGFRALQGLGAGGLFSLALAIVGDLVPPREQARYQGYFLAVFGSASVLGPVIGGFFAGADEIAGIAGWRWVFLVNVPIGALALAVVARVLRIRHERREHRIDWWGALTICLCLGPLLTVAEQGREWGWTSARSIACYAVGGAGLLLFLLAERLMREEALIPLRFFRNRTFALTAGGGFVVGMGMFGGLALLPLYLQIVRGATPTESGLQLLPMTAGIMLGSLISGQVISRTGRYRIFPVLGAALMIAGLLLLHLVGAETPYWQTGLFMGVFGLGLGGVLQPVTLAVQNAMARSEIGVATASSTFFRQMGATAGTAVFLSVLFATVGDKIGNAFRDAADDPAFQNAIKNPAPGDRPILDAVGGKPALDDTSFLEHVTPVLAHPFKVGFSDAMGSLFLLAAAVLVVAFVLFLFLPGLPLRSRADHSPAAFAESAPGPESSAAPSAQRSAKSEPGLSAKPEPGPFAESDPGPFVTASPYAGPGPSAKTEPYARPEPSAEPALELDIRPAHAPARAVHTERKPTVDTLNESEAVVLGRIDGPGGLPLPGATLTITDFQGRELARATTDSDGTYRMTPAAGGSLLLICAAENHQPAAATINVGAGEIRRVLSLAGAGQIAGRILDRAGRPVAEAALTLTGPRGEVVATANTGVDGRYAMSGLDGREYTLTATAPHASPASRTVSPGRPADLTLTVGGVLTGNVRAAGSGHPIPQASVLAVDRTGAVAGAATTGPDGRYELHDLPPGVYTVAASGHAPVATRVELTGDHTDHDITLGSPVPA